jgi:Rrf2 family nitric oxide-sensitive transcriptional repressor
MHVMVRWAGWGWSVRLTVYTDFSLRLLMYLAAKPDGISTIGEVAEAYRIPKNHLTKVAHQLGRAGYVTTVRGKGGGMRLGRPAHDIRIGDVVRETEPDMALVPCFEPVCAPCPIVPACGLRGALHQAQSAFLEVLDRYTLSDLARDKTGLQVLLGIPAGT